MNAEILKDNLTQNFDKEECLENVRSLLNSSSIASGSELDAVIDKLNSSGIDPRGLTINGLDIGYNLTPEDEQPQISEEDINSSIMQATDSSLQVYLRDVSELTKIYGFLSREREIELAKKIKKGDKEAKAELVNANLRLVIHNAFKYNSKGVSIDDLIQEGNVGLCTAAEKFDPSKGFRFSTYATWWILQKIRKLIMTKNSVIKIPPHVIYKARTIKKVTEEFKTKYNRLPSKQELSDITGIPMKTIETALNIPKNIVNIEAQIDDSNSLTYGEVVHDESEKTVDEIVSDNMLAKELAAQMAKLSPKERLLIQKYYFEGKSMQEIGVEVGRTRESVRQNIVKAREKLKVPELEKFLQSKELEESEFGN